MNEIDKKQALRTPFSVALAYLLGREKRGTAASIARQVGVKPAFISELASGRKNGKEDKRRKVADALGFPYERFLALGEFILSGVPGEEALARVRTVTGAGQYDMPAVWSVSSEGKVLRPAEGDPPEEGFVAVRKAKVALSAGGGSLVYEDGLEDVYYFRRKWLNRPADTVVMFDVVGPSMWPTFRDGGVVLVDLLDRELWDGKVYAVRVGDTVRLKRLKRSEGVADGIDVISDNAAIDEKTGKPAYPDETVDAAELHIIGRVFWHAWELK